MSVARVYTSKKVRKEWTCGKCGDKIPVGGSRIYFAVGFRGWEQTRCTKPECRPQQSELESSAVATVYAAQEGVNLDAAGSVDELKEMLEEIADACDEVAEEYEQNEMFEIYYDLQERADTVRAAGDELRNWEGDDLEEEPDEETWNDDDQSWEDAHDDWLIEARGSAQDAIDQMELP